MTLIAAWVIWAVAGLPARAQSARQVFPAPSEPPGLGALVLGIQLVEPPRVFYRGKASGEVPGVEWILVPAERDLTLSSDGRLVIFHGREGEQTWFQLPGSERVSLPGYQRFLVGGGGTTIAFSMEGDPGKRLVQRFSPHQATQSWSTPDLRWLSLSANGDTVAVGEGKEVTLHRTPGELGSSEFAVESGSGALTPDGAWLVVASTHDRAVTLTWVPVRASAAPPVTPTQVAAGGRMYFAEENPLAAYLAPAQVTFFRIDAGGPHVVAQQAAPDQSLRSVAFDRQGRIALGRLRVEKRPYRDPADVATPFRPGLAKATVEFLESARGPVVSSVEWTVPLWSYIAPELKFLRDGNLLANCGHSVHSVESRWQR